MERKDLSIRQLADVCGVSHTEIGRRMKELNIEGTPQGKGKPTLLNPAEQDKIAEALSVLVFQDDPVVMQMEIDDGNHRESRALTVQAEATSLEQFRTDRIRQGLANPAEFMTGLTSMLDQIEDGMDKAEAQQEQELLQTRQTKRQAARRIEQFRRRADEYKIKSDILASIQNDELEQLEDLASEVNRLGKPSAG